MGRTIAKEVKTTHKAIFVSIPNIVREMGNLFITNIRDPCLIQKRYTNEQIDDPELNILIIPDNSNQDKKWQPWQSDNAMHGGAKDLNPFWLGYENLTFMDFR